MIPTFFPDYSTSDPGVEEWFIKIRLYKVDYFVNLYDGASSKWKTKKMKMKFGKQVGLVIYLWHTKCINKKEYVNLKVAF